MQVFLYLQHKIIIISLILSHINLPWGLQRGNIEGIKGEYKQGVIMAFSPDYTLRLPEQYATSLIFPLTFL